MATRLLRETGNQKLVQKNLDHARLTSTSRYMHVLDKEVTVMRQLHSFGPPVIGTLGWTCAPRCSIGNHRGRDKVVRGDNPSNQRFLC
jgi:hypothetical protein